MVSKKSLEKTKNTRKFIALSVFVWAAAIIVALLHLWMMFGMFGYAKDLEHQSLSMFEGLGVIFYFFVAAGAAVLCIILNIFAAILAPKINNTQKPGFALSVLISQITFNITSVLPPIIGGFLASGGNPATVRLASVVVFIMSLIPIGLLSIRPKIKAVRPETVMALRTFMLITTSLSIFLILFVLIG